jgi:hypothetical protein
LPVDCHTVKLFNKYEVTGAVVRTFVRQGLDVLLCKVSPEISDPNHVKVKAVLASRAQFVLFTTPCVASSSVGPLYLPAIIRSAYIQFTPRQTAPLQPVCIAFHPTASITAHANIFSYCGTDYSMYAVQAPPYPPVAVHASVSL